jgi:hypothetical protein
MFQQMSEEKFDNLRQSYPSFEVGYLSSTPVGNALYELFLYRELGTLQQLSYATDAVAERDKYAAVLDRIAALPKNAPYGAGTVIARNARLTELNHNILAE